MAEKLAATKNKEGMDLIAKHFLSIVDQIKVMYEYSLSIGKTVSKENSSDYIRLIAITQSYYNKKETLPSDKDLTNDYAMAAKLHNHLKAIVTPATPESLKATERIGNSFRVANSGVNFLIYLTMICLFFFVATSFTIKFNNSFIPQLLKSLNIIFAAGLGSGFYSLTTARNYIIQRTFDPRYNQVYYVRFVLGLASGTILGFLGPDMISGDLANELSAAVLAIVGGYSAEAVSLILKRVADTLVTIVQGNKEDRIDSKEQKIKNDAELQNNKNKNAIIKKLQKINSSTDSDSNVKKELDTLIEGLLE